MLLFLTGDEAPPPHNHPSIGVKPRLKPCLILLTTDLWQYHAPMGPPASNLEIRPASSEDAARIRDLTRAAYAKWVALIGREPLPMQADYDRAVREHAIDLLTDGSALVGLIETIARPGYLWIENVAIAPDRQGRGYGRLLLAHAEKRAAEAGRDEIQLQTNATFAANLALYAKLGYAVERTEPFRGGTAVCLSKRIGARPID
jgi:ribosomal protein S18 acetylase RimI-like enzyme